MSDAALAPFFWCLGIFLLLFGLEHLWRKPDPVTAREFHAKIARLTQEIADLRKSNELDRKGYAYVMAQHEVWKACYQAAFALCPDSPERAEIEAARTEGIQAAVAGLEEHHREAMDASAERGEVYVYPHVPMGRK